MNWIKGAVAFAAAISMGTAHAAPISINAGDKLVVDFTLPAGSSTVGPVENGLFFTIQAPSYSGSVKIEIFEGNTLLESQTNVFAGTNFVQGEFYTTIVPTSVPNFVAKAPAANFPAIDDGIANGRAVFTFGAPVVLPNDPSIYSPDTQADLIGGAVVIQTLERRTPTSVAVAVRNRATTNAVSVAPVPLPAAPFLFGSVVAGWAVARRRARAG